MPRKMTRAEFEQEYGVQPEAPSSEVQAAVQIDNSPLFRSVGTGAAKELGNTSLSIAQLGRSFQRGLSRGVDAVFGTSGFGLSGSQGLTDPGSASNNQAREFLTPKGGAENFGSFATEAATFAIPGAAATRATKGAGLATRTGSLAASDAGVTVAQQGEINRETLDAAIISAVFPVAGRARSAVLPDGKDTGARIINSLIKPLLKDFSYGKNPGRAVAEAGITASSLDELTQNIRVVRQQTGQEISEALARNSNRYDASDAFTALDDAIATANNSPRTNAAIINRLENLKSDLLQVDEQGVAQRQLSDLSAQEVFDLKRDVGDLTRWTGNASDDEIVNRALKQTYGRLKGQLDDGVAGIKDLNEKYADLRSAEIASEYRDKIAARQNLISFSGQTAGIGTGLLTAAATGGVTTPLLVGAGTAGVIEASKTPRFKTQLAAWLASTPPDELAEAFNDAPWLRSTVQAILFNEAEQVEGGE